MANILMGVGEFRVDVESDGIDAKAQRQVEASLKRMDATVARHTSQMSSRLASIGDALVTAAKRTAVIGGAAVAAAGAVGINTAAQLEQARISFETMLGSAQEADSFLREMKNFAKDTPFELTGLQQSASKLIAIGIETDRIIPMMRTLGDVTSGMGTGAEGIARATHALQQMNAAQKISAEDLNQLNNAGIPVYDLLTAALGRTKEEVVGLARSGKLGKDALDAMMHSLETGNGLEKFSGLMEKQSKSLGGLWDNLKETFSLGMADAIQPLIPTIKDGLGGAITFVADHMPLVQQGMEALVTIIPDLVQWGQEFWDAFSDNGESGESIFNLSDAMDSAKNIAGPLGDTAQILGKALMFVADHSDLLVKALPFVIAGFVALKAAQSANTIIGRDSALGMVAQVSSSVALAASNWALAASLKSVQTAEATTAATRNVGTLSIARNAAATAISTTATIAANVASKAAAAGQWLLNAALSANPIGIVIIAIMALVAAVVLAYQKSETFRRIVDAAFAAVGDAARVAGGWFMQLGRDALSLWHDHIHPMVDKVLAGVGVLKRGFVAAFSTMFSAAAKPVNWFISHVINRGIIDNYNRLAKLFGSDGIGHMGLISTGGAPSSRRIRAGFQAFASGGPVRGPGTTTSDSILALLSDQEFVVRAAMAKRHTPLLHAINDGSFDRLLAQGGDLSTFLPAFAEGGLASTMAWMKSQAGKPYVWGASGPGGYDCSGFVSATLNHLMGKYPYRRVFATGGIPSWFRPGVGPVTIGVNKPGEVHRIGHTAIRVGPLGGESRGSRGVLVGGAARSPFSFRHQYTVPISGGGGDGWGLPNPAQWIAKTLSGLGNSAFGKLLTGAGKQLATIAVDHLKSAIGFDSGGVAHGTGLLAKATIEPERVLSPAQTRAFERLVNSLETGRLATPADGAPLVETLNITEAQDGRTTARHILTELDRLHRAGTR